MTLPGQDRDPTFEEGPFFYVVVDSRMPRDFQYIVWATDADTARHVFWLKTGRYRSDLEPALAGDLEDLRNSIRLSPAQITELHREGFLKIQ